MLPNPELESFIGRMYVTPPTWKFVLLSWQFNDYSIFKSVKLIISRFFFIFDILIFNYRNIIS